MADLNANSKQRAKQQSNLGSHAVELFNPYLGSLIFRKFDPPLNYLRVPNTDWINNPMRVPKHNHLTQRPKAKVAIMAPWGFAPVLPLRDRRIVLM